MSYTTNLPYEKPIDISVISTQLRFLEGKILTIIDASYSDPIQRKAVKDLITDAIWKQYEHIEGFTLEKSITSTLPTTATLKMNVSGTAMPE
jgi:hypothetical protein